jgi:hypothetical protein
MVWTVLLTTLVATGVFALINALATRKMRQA